MGVDPIHEFYLWMNVPGILWHRVAVEAEARGIVDSHSDEYVGFCCSFEASLTPTMKTGC